MAAATKHLDALLLDGSTTVQQKIDCLKLLKVVTKNLSDPAKSSDPKYRQLKLDNEKVRSKIVTCPSAVPLLVALGFAEVQEEGSPVLRVDASKAIDHAIMTTMMNEIVSTLNNLDQSNLQNKKPKLNPSNSITSSSSTSGKLSEKQKARILLEEKERKDREAAKAHREKNVALLKQDKYVRQNDENWSSKPSAACVKTGDAISTFRDKYGE
ncbi:expressed unknown protein [Seminavis robusta]|uniref:PUB domain-containing protein n=1 Tax=Seminavis robusta TaxID=568900 RepID=A0A9N8H689_9STRA|nr:expressed unknown protein [Seminavis robusta]|eukprot:Sro105_g053290.1 n/a (212) ;mRNA; r:84873-85653